MILAPTLSLSSGSGAAIVRPTFSRDFAGEKTLNNGTGPSITFTRASDATYFDANGVLQTAGTDVPRFDHSGGSSLGLLIEEARTNSIRNAQAGGSTDGVIGSGGALPTNWASFKQFGDLEVTGTGTEAGMAYVDVRFYGTNSTGSLAAIFVGAEQFAQIAASSGQAWTASFYAKLHAGSLAGVSEVAISLRGRQDDTTGTETSTAVLTPTSSFGRYTVSRALNSALTTKVSSDIIVTVANGDTIDITLRIAAPQLEQGAFPTSYIPTTTAAVTRAADSAIVTPISSFYNAAEGTLFAEGSWTRASNAAADNQVLMCFDDNSTNNMVLLYNPNGLAGAAIVTAASVEAKIPVGSTIGANTAVKIAAGIKANDVMAAVNGALGTADTSATLPTVTHLGLRGAGQGSALHLRRIAYYPRRLSNALLQSLTA